MGRWFSFLSWWLVCCVVVAAVVEGKKKDDDSVRKYKVMESGTIYEDMHWLAEKYPELVTLERAQDLYGLPTVGNSDDCIFEEGVEGCSVFILTITAQENRNKRNVPEVLLSGCLHGNERVGPTAVMETAKLLVFATSCYNSEEDVSCRQQLEEQWSIRSEDELLWYKSLVDTRRIVIVPTANALGYDRNVREEENIDPNRDFPFEILDPKKCMQTITARALNELWIRHLFVLSLTFHAGMEVVAFEWGSPSYGKTTFSPDHIAQSTISKGYSMYGGGWKQSSPYRYGTMNQVVYPVRGGMEDWAYGASWDTEHTAPCTPTTFDGYDANKTIYGNATHRTFNILVEASDHKTPPHNQLGSPQQHYLDPPSTKTSGHISRNIRLSLMAIDLLQPYTLFHSISTTTNDKDEEGEPKITTVELKSTLDPIVMIPPSQISNVVIRWTVGGAFTVDITQLLYTTNDDFVPTTTHTDEVFTTDIIQNGKTRWTSEGESVFEATLDLSKMEGDTIYVWAACQADQDWSMTPNSDYTPHVPPQSHMVNARTNPDWYFENPINKKYIQGQVQYFTRVPLLLKLDTSISALTLLNSHWSPLHDNKKNDNKKEHDDVKKEPQHYFIILSIGVIICALIFLVVKSAHAIAHILSEDDGEKDFQIVSAVDEDDDEDDTFMTTSSYKDQEKGMELPAFH